MGSLKTEQDRIQRELAQARALITQYQQDYEIIQAVFDRLWVMGIEIVGCDLKPGYVTLLHDELVAELDWQGGRPGERRTTGRASLMSIIAGRRARSCTRCQW